MIGQDWFSGLYKITFAIVEHDEQNDPILRPDLVLIRKYAIYLFEAFSEYVMNPNESTFLKRIKCGRCGDGCH